MIGYKIAKSLASIQMSKATDNSFLHKSFVLKSAVFSESLSLAYCFASYTMSKITDRLKCSAVISNCVDCA